MRSGLRLVGELVIYEFGDYTVSLTSCAQTSGETS